MLFRSANWLAVWRNETVEVPLEGGFDEISVALTADAWSRTWRSEALATNASGFVRSRRGLVIETGAKSKPGSYVLPAYLGPAAKALDVTLDDMARRYGASTADLVALGLEYPRPKR